MERRLWWLWTPGVDDIFGLNSQKNTLAIFARKFIDYRQSILEILKYVYIYQHPGLSAFLPPFSKEIKKKKNQTIVVLPFCIFIGI